MKKSERTNFRVEVFPHDRKWSYGPLREERELRDECQRLMAEIQRHVDGILAVNDTYDTVHTCSHCGARWTEKGDTFNGGCCDADVADEDARIAANQQAPNPGDAARKEQR